MIHERFGTATVELAGGRGRRRPGARGDLPASRGAARGAPGDPRRGPRRGATSRSTRWRCRSAEPGDADRPPRGRRRPARGAAARPARALVRRRPDPGAARGPLRGPARPRARAAARAELLRAADLGTVSGDRVDAELAQARRRADGPRAGFELLDEWGLVALGAGRRRADRRGRRRCCEPAVGGGASRARRRVLAAARGPRRRRLARLAAPSRRRRPRPPSPRPRGHTAVELVLARALGAAWLDDYVDEWRDVTLEISGDDLIAAGVARGPGGRPRARRGAAGEARRRGAGPRGGAAGRARGRGGAAG